MELMDNTFKILVDWQVREAAGEYCALCGMHYEDDDYENTIFVGEGVNGRSVHGSCWSGFEGLCKRLDLDLDAAIQRKRDERAAKIPPLGKRPKRFDLLQENQ